MDNAYLSGVACFVLTDGSKVSDELSKLPPQVQERLLRLQQLKQTLQTILQQKQQVDAEQAEIDQTLAELEKTADDAVIYKAAGALLVKADKAKVTADITERKELLGARTTVLARQEERMRSQLKEVQTKLQEDLNPVSAQSQ